MEIYLFTNFFSFYFHRSQPFTSIPNFGVTRSISTFQEGRLGLTHMRLSFQPTGTHPSQRSAWEWKSDTRQSSLYSSSKPVPSTHWFLMVFTDLPLWVATSGSLLLVQRRPWRPTVIRKDSTLSAAEVLLQKQELVSLVTMKTPVIPVTPESGLELEDIKMTKIHVETRQ